MRKTERKGSAATPPAHQPTSPPAHRSASPPPHQPTSPLVDLQQLESGCRHLLRGIKNEMQRAVQPSTRSWRHYHTDESPRSMEGCSLFTKLCTLAHSHTRWLPLPLFHHRLPLIVPSPSSSDLLPAAVSPDLAEVPGRHDPPSAPRPTSPPIADLSSAVKVSAG